MTQFLEEPDPGETPVSLDGARGQFQGCGDFFKRQAANVAKLPRCGPGVELDLPRGARVPHLE